MNSDWWDGDRRRVTSTPVDYTKRIYWLMVGVLTAAILVALIVFGAVLPAQQERDRIRDNSEDIANYITCGEEDC